MKQTSALSSSQRISMAQGQLITNEIIDQRLLDALMAVPRDEFVPVGLTGAAYADEDLQIAPKRYLMAPLEFSKMLTLAELHKEDNVLVIGCNMGYSLAVISHLVAGVTGCESDDTLYSAAKENIKKYNAANVRLEKVASLADGYLSAAPYDKIIIEGAVRHVPEALTKLLSEGGRLVVAELPYDAPLLVQGMSWLTEYTRIDGKIFNRQTVKVSVPLLPGFESTDKFRFR